MGIPEQGEPLSFRQRIITRGGNPVRLYHIYEDEIHGAYEADDKWYIARWNYNGYFLDPQPTGKQPVASLDLINHE